MIKLSQYVTQGNLEISSGIHGGSGLIGLEINLKFKKDCEGNTKYKTTNGKNTFCPVSCIVYSNSWKLR